jgi:hypothetical protein
MAEAPKKVMTTRDKVLNWLALICMAAFVGGVAMAIAGIWVDPPSGPRMVATGIVMIVMSVAGTHLE